MSNVPALRKGVPYKNAANPEERFWAKVDKSGDCWIWAPGKPGAGYGHFFPGSYSGAKSILAHRYAYELQHGPLPEGQHLLHKCNNRRCVNPAHLQPATEQENTDNGNDRTRSGSGPQAACKHGHAYTVSNTYTAPNGTWFCRQCKAQTQRRAQAKLSTAQREDQREYQNKAQAEHQARKKASAETVAEPADLPLTPSAAL